MPQPNDGTLESEIVLPSHPNQEVCLMDPSVASLMTQQLTQSGVIAQNNFITVQKVVDYDYLENKRMVTIDEAVGVREVQAQNSPGGPSRA